MELNIRRIRDQIKGEASLHIFKDHSPKMFFLQETYSEPSDEMIWKREWRGEIFFLVELNTVKGYVFSLTLRCGVKLIMFLTAIGVEFC